MRAVVITTINNPTASVKRFSTIQGWRTFVAGDAKTPTSWAQEVVTYLSIEDQRTQFEAFCEILPTNHYCRKMTGYLFAIRQGAEVIFDTDDDNSPKDDWSVPPFDGAYQQTRDGVGWLNIYRSFARQRIWPRGFPLELLRDEGTLLGDGILSTSDACVGIWQSLADGDPDVDAIYRLTDYTPCYFEDREPIVLGRGALCPFNSQATAFRRETFPLLYLPATVTFRFTDILRGIVAQPILWASGYKLGFTKATVTQDRNPHDLLSDFASEIPGYLRIQEVAEAVIGTTRASESLDTNLRAAYRALLQKRIVGPEELRLLDAWLEELAASSRYIE